MIDKFQDSEFPKQRVPTSEKTEAWGAASADWLIAKGQSLRDSDQIELKYSILNGEIPEDAYKKVLNPYNATKDEYKRFPATLRHYDMFKGIIRRYVSEYLKNPHEIIVGANNPEVVLAKDAKLKEQLGAIVEQKIAAKIQESYAQWMNEGNDPKEFKPEQALDIESFIKEFNKTYIDDISAQGQEILNVIRDITEDALFYAKAYFDFVSFGEVYTYADVIGTKFIKTNIQVRDAFPIRTNNQFIEDDDAFVSRRKVTYQQVMDEFGKYFDDNDEEFVNLYYGPNGSASNTDFNFSTFEKYFPDVCDKYSNADRAIFKQQKFMGRDNSSGVFDLWHVVWRGEVRKAVVTFINEVSLIDTREENDDYKLNTAAGDISIEYYYKPQVLESVRLGGKTDSIYPYGTRAIAFDRDGKLPYNGADELLPGFGRFSIVEIIAPHNIFYNIVAYHREMAIAKNKLSILVMAKSLLGKIPEDVIYKMIADGVIYYDDEDDQAGVRAQNIRMLQASNSDYIVQLGNLLLEIETTAKNQVDMTPQRYGDIANNAGKGVTDEAIARGSMGSVIIEFVMDTLRERDYARDMDYTKLAWIDGLNTSYRDADASLKYISLNVENHNYADYIIKAKNSVKEREKREAISNLAFTAGQNGDMEMAIAAIEGDNVAAISKLIKEYSAKKQAHEENLKQLEQQTEQMRQEFETKKIQIKGEEDRKLEELKGIIESEIQLIKADANMISFDNGMSDAAKNQGLERLEASRASVERDKIQFDKERSVLDAYAKFEDRKLKNKDIDTKLQIAKENKNRFDVKKPNKAKR